MKQSHFYSIILLLMWNMTVQAQAYQKVFKTLEGNYPGLKKEQIRIEQTEFLIKTNFTYKKNDYIVFFSNKGTSIKDLIIEHHESVPELIKTDITLRVDRFKVYGWKEEIDYVFSYHRHTISIKTEETIEPGGRITHEYLGLVYDSSYRYVNKCYLQDEQRSNIFPVWLNRCNYYSKEDTSDAFSGQPVNFFSDSLRLHIKLSKEELLQFQKEDHMIMLEAHDDHTQVYFYSLLPFTLRKQIQAYTNSIQYLHDGCAWINIRIEADGIYTRQTNPNK